MESSSDTRWMDALQGFALLEEYQKRRGNLQVRTIFHFLLPTYHVIRRAHIIWDEPLINSG